MGYALPAAIGAAFALPGRKVVALAGDASLLMSSSDLVTVAQHRLPIVLGVHNDGRIGMIEYMQRMAGRTPYATEVGDVDYVRLAEAAGNAALAEMLTRDDDDVISDAASDIELHQLAELAAPADTLSEVAGKLAMALRLSEWKFGDDDTSYGTAIRQLIASSLSDLIVLRAAEWTLRQELARAASKAACDRPAGEVRRA